MARKIQVWKGIQTLTSTVHIHLLYTYWNFRIKFCCVKKRFGFYFDQSERRDDFFTSEVSLVKYQKSHSFAAHTRSISYTSATRVKIPYARAFHEVISLSFTCISIIYIQIYGHHFNRSMPIVYLLIITPQRPALSWPDSSTDKALHRNRRDLEPVSRKSRNFSGVFRVT